MTRKQIAIVVLILVFLIAIMDLSRNGFTFFEEFIQQPNFYGTGINPGVLTTASEEKQLMVNPENKNKLCIYSPSGQVRIKGTDTEDIHVRAIVSVYAESEDIARDYLGKIELISEKRLGSIIIDLEHENSLPSNVKGIRVNYIVEAPKDLALDLESYGYMSVKNFAGPVAVRSSGRIEISDIVKNLDIGMIHGYDDQIKVSDIDGNIKINAIGGNFHISNVHGNIDSYGQSSIFVFENVQGNIMNENYHGNLSARKIQGQITAMGGYLRVFCEEVEGKVRVRTRYGDVQLLNVQKDVDIDAVFSDITITSKLNHRIKAKAYMGEIQTENRSIDIVKNKFSYEFEDQLGNGEFIMTVNTRYGDIIFEDEIK